MRGHEVGGAGRVSGGRGQVKVLLLPGALCMCVWVVVVAMAGKCVLGVVAWQQPESAAQRRCLMHDTVDGLVLTIGTRVDQTSWVQYGANPPAGTDQHAPSFGLQSGHGATSCAP